MRNKAGFMILALLLLAVPVLANAWTLTVKVSGASADNYVTTSFKLADGTLSTKSFKGNGTSYLYPTSRVTVARTGATPNVLTFAGFSQYSSVATQGNQILTVTYNSTVSYKDLNLTQAAGGAIYAQNLNNTWSATGVLQALTGTTVNVAIAADLNHKISGYHTNLSATVQNVAVTGAAGEVVIVPITLSATETIIPDFAVAGNITASLFTPTTGQTGKAFNVSVTATSNDTGLLYSFSSDNGATYSTPSAAASKSITLLAGTYQLVAKVTSANGGSFVTPAASIVIADAPVVQNQSCTSCHSTQPSAITGPTVHACTVCHSAEPHAVGTIVPYSLQTLPGNSPIVNATTFLVMSTNVKVEGTAVAQGALFCTGCHKAPYAIPHQTTNLNAGFTCSGCHTSDTGVGGTKDLHSIQELSCIGCHAVGQQNPFSDKTLVNDNNGVRSITNEFAKWSHHVTGVELQDAHCAACHLEGKVSRGKVQVDSTLHMIDNKIHLRNADTDADMAWNPEAPDHSLMDNFCMTCHDANGATSAGSIAIQAVIVPAAGKTASATNPFGDTISNQYDKMERSAVVDAKGQFNTGNNSHHAVMGKRYTGNSRLLSGTNVRPIYGTPAFNANSSATLPGARSTIFDAGRFEPTYRTLANAAGETNVLGSLTGRNGGTALGDDSTLHCGDCHTVGQFAKQGSTAFTNLSTSFAGGVAGTSVKKFYKTTIGAHGSNNEYLLRNSIGTDQRHVGIQYTTTTTAAFAILDGSKPYLVCYNCHVVANYGTGSHLNEKAGANEDCNGAYNTRAEPNGALNKVSSLTPVINPAYTGIGEDRLRSIITVQAGTSGGVYGAQTTGHGGQLGNIYGIQCANCHNSSWLNGFGGIHGSKVNTYTDGLGNTTKVERLMPGLGNVMFVPGTVGGYTGGTQAVYKVYSANRNGTGTGKTSGQTFTQLPIRNVPYTAGQKQGSFNYTTGGVTKDTNWEQKNSAFDVGSTGGSEYKGATGCYTLSVKGTARVNALQSAGYPADDVRLSPSDNLKAVDGNELLDNWGGCEDHGSVAGASSEPFIRGIVRPITY